MKHFVNLSLLFFFVTLVFSGLLRFFQPFDLVTTRVHIAFGVGTLVLVAWHLSSRGKYFANLFSKRQREKSGSLHPAYLLAFVLIVWSFWLVAALWNFWPIDSLISASYEARHAREIFRDNSKTAFERIESGMQVKRVTDNAASVRLELEWGPSFAPEQSTGQPLGKQYPQIAIWAENEDGTILETLFVSQACAAAHEFDWLGQRQSRSDILPVWYSRYKKILGREPQPQVDAVSSATPVRDFSLEGYLAMNAQPFAVYVEVNAPADTNEFFHHDQPKGNEGYTPLGIGQPSIVYEAFVFPEATRSYFLLELSGWSGSPFSETNELVYELEKLTSSKRIIEKILLHVVWPSGND